MGIAGKVVVLETEPVLSRNEVKALGQRDQVVEPTLDVPHFYVWDKRTKRWITYEAVDGGYRRSGRNLNTVGAGRILAHFGILSGMAAATYPSAVMKLTPEMLRKQAEVANIEK